jgi:hypothetical protein
VESCKLHHFGRGIQHKKGLDLEWKDQSLGQLTFLKKKLIWPKFFFQQKKQYEYQKAEFYADSKSVEMIVEKVFFISYGQKPCEILQKFSIYNIPLFPMIFAHNVL